MAKIRHGLVAHKHVEPRSKPIGLRERFIQVDNGSGIKKLLGALVGHLAVDGGQRITNVPNRHSRCD